MPSDIISTQGGTTLGMHSGVIYYFKTLMDMTTASLGITSHKSHMNIFSSIENKQIHILIIIICPSPK